MVGCAVDGKDSRRGKRRKQPGLSGMGGNFATLRWAAAWKALHVLMIHHFGTHEWRVYQCKIRYWRW